jgi:sugar lactone lactonase YvrE
MNKLACGMVILCVAASLAGCGGGSSPSSNSSGITAATVLTLKPGSSYTMTAGTTLLVPAGTTITAQNGTTVTVNGSNDVVFTQVGAIISVSAGCTGPADNRIETSQSTAGMTGTSKATVSVIAGSSTSNLTPTDGTGSSAVFWGGGHLALTSSGDLIVSDYGRLRKVTPAGVVQTLWSTDDSFGFDGIAVDAAGNVFGAGQSIVASGTMATSISEFTTAGTFTKLAPDWEISTMGSGGVAMDKAGNIYYADGASNRIVKFTSDGTMSVFAGGICGGVDGVGTAASFDNPRELAIDANGNLYTTNHIIGAPAAFSSIRKITPDGRVSTVAGLPYPAGPITVDGAGNIYTAFSFTVTRTDTHRNVTSFSLPQLANPITSLVADGQGNLYAGTRGLGAEIVKISFGN